MSLGGVGVLALLDASGFLIGGGAALDKKKKKALFCKYGPTHLSLEKHMVSVITYIFFKREKKNTLSLKNMLLTNTCALYQCIYFLCVCLFKEILSKKQKARRGNVIWGCFSS